MGEREKIMPIVQAHYWQYCNSKDAPENSHNGQSRANSTSPPSSTYLDDCPSSVLFTLDEPCGASEEKVCTFLLLSNSTFVEFSIYSNQCTSKCGFAKTETTFGGILVIVCLFACCDGQNLSMACTIVRKCCTIKVAKSGVQISRRYKSAVTPYFLQFNQIEYVVMNVLTAFVLYTIH